MPRKLRIGHPRDIRIWGEGTTFTLNGNAASLIKSIPLAAASGSYTVVGQSNTLTVTTGGGGGGPNTITAASAQQSDVSSAIASATAGDTVRVPAGTATWSGLNISKAIHLVGAAGWGAGTTTITLNGSNVVTKQAAGVIRISGFTFNKSGGGNNSKSLTFTGSWKNAKPIIFENNIVTISATGFISITTPGGIIISNNRFTGEWDDSFITPKQPGDGEGSWRANSTMGDADVNGEWNIYVEDNTFRGGTNQGIDADDGGRVVFRHNLCEYMSFNSHGMDTSEDGVRHFEVYRNEFRNSTVSGGTPSAQIANQNWAIWIRGGTGTIFQNYIDDIANSSWGTGKSEAKFDIRAQQDNSGVVYGTVAPPTAKYSCGAGDYPRVRQLGQSWDESRTNPVNIAGGAGDYITDPIYAWSNFGPGTTGGVFLGWANGGSWGSQAGYFNDNRDYTFSNLTKAGYKIYTYPHPLRLSLKGTSYYVDSVTGNDSNTGTITSPWRNCPGMASYTGSGTLAPGDRVYFNKNGSWNVTGTQGIWLVGGVMYIGDEWGTSGTRATFVATAALSSSICRFRDHATIPTVFKGFDCNANGQVAGGIEMNHAFAATALTGATKRIENCIVRNVWSRTSQGTFKYGIIISNHVGTAGEVANVEIVNCEVHDISRDGILLYPGDENNNCIVRNILVSGCTAYNCGQDPDYGVGHRFLAKGRVIDAVFEYNYATGVGGGAGFFINTNETNHFGTGPSNIHIRHNIVNVDSIHGSIRIYDGSGTDPKDVKIYGNIVYNNPSQAGFYMDGGVSGSNNQVRVYNNTFYNARVLVQSHPATYSAFEFRNNIIYDTSNTPVTDSGGKMATRSHNLMFRSGGGTLASVSGTNYTSANITTWDANALSSDPLFQNLATLPTGFSGIGLSRGPNTTGFTLQTGSPARNSGFALAVPYHTSISAGVIRPLGSAFDRGAYEA